MRDGAEVCVARCEAGQLRDAESGLDREGEHRSVASSDPGSLVRRAEQRVDLVVGEVRDECSVVAFGWDREDACDQRGVLGMTEAGEAVERSDRGQARVAGADGVLPVVLEVLQERGDQVGI